MEIKDLKGQHLTSIQAYLQSLTILYPEIDEDQDQMLVRLAMLLHDEDPTNMTRANELLDSSGAVYVAYVNPIIDLNSLPPSATLSDDGTYHTVVLPEDGRTITIRPLTGRQWRLALTDAHRLARTAAMSGLSTEECQALSLLDYLTIEIGTLPFVTEVLTALTIGGGSSPDLSEEESASPT